MKWLILNGDGSTWTDEQGSWAEAPSRDVQFVLFRDHQTGWTLRHGGDFFRMDSSGQPVCMDTPGMIDHVTHDLGVVKQGKMLSSDHWQALFRRAVLLRKELQGAENAYA